MNVVFAVVGARRMRPIVVGVVAVALLIFTACTTPATAAKRVALIVANEAYADAPLQNPAKDASIVGPSLKAAGFEVTIVNDVDLAAFDLALTNFVQAAQGADVALFYFSGHGFAVSEGLEIHNMLMSTSADITSTSERVLRAGGLSLSEVILSVSRAAKTALFFVDACRNDPRVSRSVGGTGRVMPVVRDVGARNIFVGLSTRLGTTATDGPPGRGTAFARAFAEHMAKPGVRVDDAFGNVRRAVEQETGDTQSPEIARIDLDAPVFLSELDEEGKSPVTEDGSDADSTVVATGVTDCDLLASDPLDLARVAPGIEWNKIDEQALGACAEAVKLYPDQPRLRTQYARALSMAKREEEALAQLEIASADGHQLASEYLALSLMHGTNATALDHDRGLSLLQEAESAGSAHAGYQLYLFYRNGGFPDGSEPRAYHMLESAAGAGYYDALKDLAWHYYYDLKDYQSATYWYQRGVDAGHAEFSKWLFYIYDDSAYVGRDPRKAAEYFVAYARHVRNDQALRDDLRGDVDRAKWFFQTDTRIEIQRQLSNLGHYDAPVDGDFGPRTIDAIYRLMDGTVS